MPRFCIDGTLEDDTLGVDKTATAPWYVFDIPNQTYITGPLRYWLHAWLIVKLLGE